MDSLVKDDSYARRRDIFKNIWISAIKPVDNRPAYYRTKVIKTARLSSELQKYNFFKKKHQKRIKHLKITCEKILDPNTQTFFEQLTASHPLRKIKRQRKKKQSSKKDELRQINSLNTMRSTSPGKEGFSKSPVQCMAIKTKGNYVEQNEKAQESSAEAGTSAKRRRRKLVRKKRGKRKNHRSL